MRNAMLLIDDPGCCGNCSLMESYLDEEHERWLEKCVPVYRNIPDCDEKPEWCPLRALPEKEYVPHLGFMEGEQYDYELGWNACIDAITKTE